MPHGFFGGDRQQQQGEEDFGELSRTLRETGGTATRAALQGQLDFDPSQAVTDFGSGFLDEAREGLGQDFERLVGGSVGRGRLRTGFFQQDAGRLFQDFNRRVSNAIAQQSLEASRQRLANLQGLGAFGTNILDQQGTLLAGAADLAQGAENAEPGNPFARIGGAILGGAAGFAIGGPPGAFAGANVGQEAFS
jgi:hypothetical protein